ncbi:MAG: hypothetical protein Q9198_005737 [Flavoplaca austrocitrina]
MVSDAVVRSEKKVPAVWTTDGPVGVEDGELDEDEDEDNEESAVEMGVEDDVDLGVEESIDVDNVGSEVEERDADEVVIVEEVDELAEEDDEDGNIVLAIGEEVGENVNDAEDAGGEEMEESDAVEEDGVAVVGILCAL